MQVERVMIDELDCDPANVRAHDAKNLDAIKSSLKRFGQQKPIVVNEKGIVIAGNGTLTAARALGWDSINIITTELDGVNATAYAIADNRTGELAEWDEEALAKQLSALQIEDEALVEAAGFSDEELTALVDEVVGDGLDASNYTRKVDIPIYEPSGEKPETAELFDRSKTDELIKKIQVTELPGEIESFLIAAAQRHTAFNFTKIANYYAHSESDIQELFEESALVIIDFNKAIERGFVKMTSAMREAVRSQIDEG